MVSDEDYEKLLRENRALQRRIAQQWLTIQRYQTYVDELLAKGRLS